MENNHCEVINIAVKVIMEKRVKAEETSAQKYYFREKEVAEGMLPFKTRSCQGVSLMRRGKPETIRDD